MSIKYYRHEEIDPLKWDRCIAAAVNGNIYAYSWYLNLVSPCWDALIMGDYEYLMPLTHRRKWGVSYLYQPCFTQKLGVFSASHLREGITDSFLAAIPGRFRLVEISLNALNKATAGSFHIRYNTNLELDLIRSYDEISKGYSDNLRRNLRRAQQSGTVIHEIRDAAPLVKIFTENRGRGLKTLFNEDYGILLDLIAAARKRDATRVLGAVNRDGVLCAGAVFMLDRYKAVFLFSATNPEARASGMMPLLIDQFIGEHSGQALVLDFEGSNDPDLARFYRSFGAKDCPYPFIERNTLPAIFKKALCVRHQLRYRWSRPPLGASQAR